jgi:NADH-quinone oxidoreductase subunit N
MELDGWQSFAYFWPEAALAASALAVALLAALPRLDRSALGELAILGASLSVFFAARLAGWGEVWIFERTFAVDGFAVFFKILIGVTTVGVLWIALEPTPRVAARQGRACVLVLLAALGLDLMASAASLWVAFLAVELASLALWALLHGARPVDRQRGPARGARAIGAAMLCGVAWLAGFCQSADYEDVHRAVFELAAQSAGPLALALGAVVLASPLRALLSASGRESRQAPALDALVAIGFAAGGLALAMRLLFPVMSTPGAGGRWAHAPGLDWPRVLAAAAVGAMTVGNVGALRERSLRRLLVATAIAHVGYTLIALAAASDGGFQAALFYVASFCIAGLGAFHLAALIGTAKGSEALDAMAGLLRGRQAPVGIALGAFVLSLAGAPLLIGFRAKLHVFHSALDHGSSALAAVAGVNAVLSCCAYARVLLAMGGRDERGIGVRLSAYDASLAAALFVATVAFGIYEAPLFDLAGRSMQLLPR